MDIIDINFLDIEENTEYINTLKRVLDKCFEEENLKDKKDGLNSIYAEYDKLKDEYAKEHNWNLIRIPLKFLRPPVTRGSVKLRLSC